MKWQVEEFDGSIGEWNLTHFYEKYPDAEIKQIITLNRSDFSKYSYVYYVDLSKP